MTKGANNPRLKTLAPFGKFGPLRADHEGGQPPKGAIVYRLIWPPSIKPP